MEPTRLEKAIVFILSLFKRGSSSLYLLIKKGRHELPAPANTQRDKSEADSVHSSCDIDSSLLQVVSIALCIQIGDCLTVVVHEGHEVRILDGSGAGLFQTGHDGIINAQRSGHTALGVVGDVVALLLTGRNIGEDGVALFVHDAQADQVAGLDEAASFGQRNGNALNEAAGCVLDSGSSAFLIGDHLDVDAGSAHQVAASDVPDRSVGRTAHLHLTGVSLAVINETGQVGDAVVSSPLCADGDGSCVGVDAAQGSVILPGQFTGAQLLVGSQLEGDHTDGPYFYDACDRAGLVVWAEIPFISVMHPAPGAHENCRSQMKELIVQNYNHPSICFWGISNEITIGGERPGLLDNLRDLNALAHEMDKTRMTTIAHVSMVPMENDMHHITDVLSYNHYFGWYGGELENNEQWLDKFHALHPDRPLGISEYGAEGIVSYHSDTPKCKDYTEEYQVVYHEHLAKVIDERPWLWATHVWNMFDFGCDARDEGGVKGRNNKGLMTLDRKIRKDAFYLYKAYWSDEEFVHLCSRRYAQRTGEETTVKVYSNLPKVALYVDGRLFAEQEGSKVFVFEHVPMSDGFTQISARAGACADAMSIEKVAEPNQAYIYVDPDDTGDDAGAANWFNVDDYKDVDTIVVREGYFSVKDKIGDIMKNEEAGNVLMQFMQATVKMKLKKSMLGMVKDMTLEGMAGMASSMGIGGKAGADPEQGKRMLITLNEMLNKIKK